MAEVVPMRKLDDVVRLVGRKLETLEDMRTKGKAIQIEIGNLLVELKERIDAGEVGEQATWEDWFEDNRMRFRNIAFDTARKYMDLVRKPDPEAALATQRQQNAANNRKHRTWGKSLASRDAKIDKIEEKPATPANVIKITAPPKEPLSSEQTALIEQFVSLFRQMTDEARGIAVNEINAIYRRWKEGEE